jgi:hypothetical protein
MNITKIAIVSIILLLTIPLSAHAGVSTGLEWQYQDDGSCSLDTLKIDADVTKHWTMQANYDRENEDLSADIIYKTKTDTRFQPYIGIGARDLLQKSDNQLSTDEKIELAAGVIVNLSSNSENGLYLNLEMKAVPSAMFKDSNPDILEPRIGISLNYRFPKHKFHSQGPTNISKSDYELLGRLVTAEAGNESYTGQVAVAAVVLNRINSGKFPNSIREVIYQKGQFTSLPKLPRITPTESSLQAVTAALNGQDPSRGALYFYNPKTCSREGLAFFRSGKMRTTAKIGNHVFVIEQ